MQTPVESKKKYDVVRYFDDYLDKVIERNVSLERANELLNSLKPGAYVSYGKREVESLQPNKQ